MITIEKSISINRSLPGVFSFVSDYRNDILWRSGVLAMKQEPETGATVGTKTYETIKFMGRTLTVIANVTGYKLNEIISFRTINSPIKTEGFRKVFADNGKTVFIYSISAELKGIYKLFSSSIAKQFSKRVELDLQKLKDILEEVKQGEVLNSQL